MCQQPLLDKAATLRERVLNRVEFAPGCGSQLVMHNLLLRGGVAQQGQ